MRFTHNEHHHCKKTCPPGIKKVTGCRPADITPALFLTVVQLFNNWRVGMVVTDGRALADLEPPWWRGPVGSHDDVIKWKHFPRYRPFVRGIHRSPANSPHKGQWCGALMFSLIYKRLSKQSWGWWLEMAVPNAGVAQREYWEWRMTFSFRYNVVLTKLCKWNNHWQIWVNSLKSIDA